METITLEQLHEDLAFTGDLMIDGTFVLLPKTSPVSNELIAALKEWEFDEFYSEGALSLGGDIGVNTLDKNGAEASDTPAPKIGESVKKALESSKNILLDNSDNARMEMVERVYNEYMNYIEDIFTHYATHKQIDQDDLSETVKELCVFIKENRRFILRVNPSVEESNKNFLVIHSIRTTVIAITIALQLHMPLSKMIELGVCSILHEIGMLRLPPQIYMTDKQLTPGERGQIFKHTIFGYTIAKDLEFPLSIQLGILEHHEKEDGAGYPQRKTGDKISTIAKIISVACSYEAITSPRSYKDERSTFEAIVELIQNKHHSYDDSIIRALLFSVSLYPIGSYVYLTNRKVAVVTDSNQNNPKLPVVQLLTEKQPDGSPITIQTGFGETSNITVARILTKTEKQDIIRLVNDKYAAIQEAQQTAALQESMPKQPKPIMTAANMPNMNAMEEIDINEFN